MKCEIAPFAVAPKGRHRESAHFQFGDVFFWGRTLNLKKSVPEIGCKRGFDGQ